MKHKYYSLLFLAGITYTNSFAQPFIKTQRAAGGSSEDIFTCMAVTKDGGLIAGGSSSSNISGEKTENSRGGYYGDYWVVKYDSSHNIQWDKTIGGNSNEELYSIQQTRDGGYILGGYSLSDISGEKTENSRGGTTDYWIVKLDDKGNIQWDKTIGGYGDDELLSLQQTSDGGYILGGYSHSDISGEKTENSGGSADYWIVKLDDKANIQWDKTIGGNYIDVLRSLQQTSDSGYILGGNSYSNKSGEKTSNSRGLGDYWVVKLDNAGNIKWDKTIGANGNDVLIALQQTTDEGFILGGISDSDSSYQKTEKSRGAWDYWIVKLNKYGKIQWDKTIGGNSSEFLASIQQTQDGGYILGGSSSSNISGEKTEVRKGGSDYWIVKLRKNGKFQWDKTIGGNNYDASLSVKEISLNRYVTGGYSYSKATGDKTRLGRGGADYWLVWLNYKKPAAIEITSAQDLNSTNVAADKSKDFIAYPNPAKNSVIVNFTAQKNGQYLFELTDLSGKILLRKQTSAMQGGNHTNIDVSRFVKGVYFINIIKPDKTKERIQLVKE